ncbi:GlsB/YeaQ/YmgE family stress response membrane protein, partial [Rhizobium ruizarguesonis]
MSLGNRFSLDLQDVIARDGRSSFTRGIAMESAGIGWIAEIVIGGIAGWLAEMLMKSNMG